ncbi:MAG: serine hydrolase [Bacteroidota bacterium]
MHKTYLILLFLAFANLSFSQVDTPPLDKDKMDSLAMLVRETFAVPGFAVGILVDGEVYYTAGVGVQGLDSQVPMSTSSLFHMASVSKPFVATAIMQLAEAGKVKLEDKVIDHLPYFKMADDNYRNITILQVLNHTSGIPDVEDYEWGSPEIDDGAAERYVRSFADSPLDFEPGTDNSYSNASFDIMADLIAKVSGMTFEDYMTKHIFEPAGMKNSTFFKPEVPAELATQPHGLDDQLQMAVLDVYPYNRIHAPSSTLHSNVDDMLRWAMLYLNRGKIDGKQVFSEETYTALTTRTWEYNETNAVCLSWFTSEVEGETLYYHGGGDDGYRTFFGFFPELKAAVVVMGNNNSFQSTPATGFFARNFILNTPRQWKKHIQFDLKDLILTEGIESCKAYYHKAKADMPDQYEWDAGDLDDLGYWLLDRGKNQEALDVFMFMIELEPEHAGWHDSVADAYVAMEDTAKAIEWYEKALELNPEQGFTIDKLKELKEKTADKD